MVGSEILVGVVLGTVSVLVVWRRARRCTGLRGSSRPAGCRSGGTSRGSWCFIAIGLRPRVAHARPARSADALGNLLFVPMFLLGGGGPPREVMTGADVVAVGCATPQPRRGRLAPCVARSDRRPAPALVAPRCGRRARWGRRARRPDAGGMSGPTCDDRGAEAVDDLGVVELLGHPHRVHDGRGRRRPVADDADAVDAEEHGAAGVVGVELA